MNSLKLIIFLIGLTSLAFANGNKENDLTLIQLLQVILNDPEFLALSDQQQLRILYHIYAMLEKYLVQNNPPTIIKALSAQRNTVLRMGKHS